MEKVILRLIFLTLSAVFILTGCSKMTDDNTDVNLSDSQTVHNSTEIDFSAKTVTLSEDELYDKMLGGWIGQMAGVTWAASTEFRWCGEIIPEKSFPIWKAEMINDAFGQDDLYVEIPFLDAMKEHGADCDPKYVAEKFRDSKFSLWHANYQGRQNLRSGIEYPDSGNYKNNYHADDIDWQIECDFLGQMYPGMVSRAAERSFELGHIMNYGDGVYGGVFICAMHSAAFTAKSIDEIIEAGISVIPEGTLFRDVMNDVMESYAAGDTWEENWQMLEDKWADTDKCIDCRGAINIDAKLNSAYVLIGLLYGEGDFAKTIEISTRCGQDSDCNPSTAAAILGNYYGASGIPDIYKQKLDYSGRVFSNTSYTLEEVIEINFDLMKEILVKYGATESGGIWTIDAEGEYDPVPFEQWPDGLNAILNVTPAGNKAVKLSLMVFGDTDGKDLSVKYDMGDGYTCCTQPAYYKYEEAGEYTVRCTVTDSSGNEITLENNVVIDRNINVPGKAFCSVSSPTGGGNKNINVIYDGVVPPVGESDSLLQYDTYTGGEIRNSVNVGVEFSGSAELTGVKFTEGKHFGDGGWFEGAPYTEVLIDGQWVKTEATISPEYPSDAGQSQSFETYTFTFNEAAVCDGVRISGKPGGSAYFISIGEITPLASEVYTEENEDEMPIIICSVTNPTGGGSSDISVICDGVVPDAATANDKMQYDTYTGNVVKEAEYIGYLYRAEREVSNISFTEGNHFNNGGWFGDGEIYVQLYINGEWITPQYSMAPEYPNGNKQSDFKNGYETYNFTLDTPQKCSGVRIYGKAGGSSTFISASEINVK